MTMKQIRTIKSNLLLGFILLFLAACSQEYIPVDTFSEEDSGGIVKVGLFTGVYDFEKPVSKAAADENNPLGSMPWVFVFRGDGNDAPFIEAVQARTTNGRLFVELTKTTDRSQLLILANPPDKFFDGTTDNKNLDKVSINAALSGKTYVQALAGIMNTQKLSSPQPVNPYGGGYIPMSASVTLNNINEQTTIGTPSNKVQLTRIIAKVTIVKENTDTGFSMEGFTVAGAKQFGRFFESASFVQAENTVNYEASAPADPVTGISSGNEPVYIYESLAGETSVIIKGKYNLQTCYYRLAFKDSNHNLLNIERNKWYEFKIKNVETPGYKTLNEALNSPASNIMAELLVTDLSSMEITDNGQYYIGLSNSQFCVYSNSTQRNLEAVTITTNAPAGVKTSVEIVSANPLYTMSVSSGNIVPDGTVKGTDLKINISSAFTKGLLKITVGNLIRTVEVERKPLMPWTENNLTFTSDYVSAKIENQGNGGAEWLTLSTDGVRYVNSEVARPDNPGSIYLKVSNNESGISLRSGGVVYLARKDAEGHLKLYIIQEFCKGK